MTTKSTELENSDQGEGPEDNKLPRGLNNLRLSWSPAESDSLNSNAQPGPLSSRLGGHTDLGPPKPGTYGLSVITDPDGATMDIVLVHGLMGDAYRSWLHGERDVYWPRDLLGSDFENARIMVFGYDIDVWHPWKQVSQGWLSGYAVHLLSSLSGHRKDTSKGRPLVFIGHSLGGLVVQQALITARESRKEYWRQIETHTKGICFLGTPHRGASLASWGERAARFLNHFKPVNHRMVSLLEPESKPLHELRRAFHNVLEKRKEEWSRINVVCFYETIPSFRSCIVSEQSATIDGEPSFPIYANHGGMAKFVSRLDEGYRSMVQEINHMVSDKESGHLCPSCGKQS